MATLATFFRGPMAANAAPARPQTAVETDPYRLRAFPNDDVFFFSKRIDNSHVVREADPRARGRCWSAIAGAGAAVVVVGALLVPAVLTRLEGYRLQELRAEEQRLVNERRVLALEEARLLSPDRLVILARDHQFATPATGQVVRLDEGQAKSSLAMNRK